MKRFEVVYYEKGYKQDYNCIVRANSKEEVVVELDLPNNYRIKFIDELSENAIVFCEEFSKLDLDRD